MNEREGPQDAQRRQAALVAVIEEELAPHLWGGALMFSAGLQICAVSSAATIVEYSLLHNPMQQELDQEPIAATDGEVVIPDRPGLGVSINQDFVDRFKVK